jgi:hypothetical protein
MLVGGWLFLSAFLWPHSMEQMLNAGLVGALTVALAISSRAPGNAWVRRVIAVVATWLLLSTLVLPAGPLTLANHLLVSVLLFCVAAEPSPLRTGRRDGFRV